MPKRSSKVTKDRSSKKLDPAITVALIALVGTLVTALFSSPVIIAWLQRTPVPSAQTSPPISSVTNSSPTRTPAPSAQTSAPISTVTDSSPTTKISPTASVPDTAGGTADCLAQFFSQNNIEPARQINIEAGAYHQDYVISSQDLSSPTFIGPFGINLTQNGKMIAALSFLYFPSSDLFKITSLVDTNCQDVVEYSNTTQGGDRNALRNYYDALRIQLSEGTFVLSPEFFGGNLFQFDFTKSE